MNTEVTPQTDPVAVDRYLNDLRAAFERAFETVVTGTYPQELYDPARYVLGGKGKRLRPLLVLISADLFGVPPSDAMGAAVAVEVFHNFTLVHDDIMDHAATRRGRPTVHVAWDESTAILCGDLLQGLAFRWLARTRRGDLHRITEAFASMIDRLCEGQTLDKQFESAQVVTVDQYLDMIDRKTAALLVHCLELGGLIGGASTDQIDLLRRIGQHLGRAFQIQDDLLDLTADDDKWGKPVGGDLVEGKKTFLLLRTLECTSGPDHDWFQRIIDLGGLVPELIPEAKRRMQVSGVLQEAADQVVGNTREALHLLDLLPAGVPAEALRSLFLRMEARVH